MKEELIAFVWKHGLFSLTNLFGTGGEEIQILHPGFENHHAGPDFNEALVSIDGVIWAGNAEIHLVSSDWYKHKHHQDPAYDKVVLHIVYAFDKPVYRNDGSEIPCLELNSRIPQTTIERFEELMTSMQWIPCQSIIESTSSLDWVFTLEEKGIERIQRRVDRCMKRLEELNGHWDQMVYEYLFRAFGFGLNAEGFELLARRVPVHMLKRESNDELNVQALLLGTANCIKALHVDQLNDRYKFMKHKHQISPLRPGMVKHLRTRPSNFPEHRIRQITSLICSNPMIMREILDVRTRKELFSLLSPAFKGKRKLSVTSLDLLLINVVAPLKITWNIFNDMPGVTSGIVEMLTNIPKENNRFTRKWSEIGIKAQNALQSQGLYNLFHNYCRNKLCLNCKIGARLLHDHCG